MKKALTPKQQNVLNILRERTLAEGRSPSLHEVREALGLKSLRTVTQYLESLERKGYILRHKNAVRNIEFRTADSEGMPTLTVSIPVVANVGCDDLSVFASDQHDEFLEVDKELAENSGEIVAVRAVGDSMLDAGIHSGDYILVQFTEDVKNGDRVAAIVGDMVTVKRLERREGVTVLWPESKDPKYKPIILKEDFRITGKVLCVIPRPQTEITEVVPLQDWY